MLHQCLEQPMEALFLQKRQGAASPRGKQLNIAFNSHFQEKKSLKTLKSIRSHKSLKTIDSETHREHPQIISMRAIQKDDKTQIKSPEIQKGFINLQSPIKTSMKKKEEINLVKCRSRIEKKLSFPLPHSINRVSIRFGDQITLRKFLSPQPKFVMEKAELNEAPKTPQLPKLNLTNLLKRSSQLSNMKEEALSITFRQSPEQIQELRSVCEDEKDWDMKSTHHVDQNTLAIPLPLPSKAKSTVSMISDRSDCDSIVMGRLPINGKLTKLL